MGKHLQRQDSGVGSNRPGCMGNLMHMFDYHHWNTVKKILPHRKRAGGRRVRCNNGSRKMTLNNRDIPKRQDLAVAEAEPLLVKQNSTETSSPMKRSGKPRAKASSAKEKPKEESPKSWILSFHVQSWLWRTSGVHDAQPSENYLDTTRNSSTTSPRRLQDSSHLKMWKNTMKTKQPNKDICSDQFDDHVDILEIFKVNKEFFLKILQDPDVSTNKFSGLQNSKSKVKLTKSRSFPVADSSRARKTRPSTLKHKQNEIWSFPKGGKLIQTPNLVTTESQEDCTMKSMPYMKQEPSFTSSGLLEGFNNQGWNQSVINRFKYITQKLMYAIQESKKENVDTSIKALFGKELFETPEIAMEQEGKEADGLEDSVGKRRRVRRTSSLDESLNRYTQLFENSYSSDQIKWDRSRSVKLKSEEKVSSTRNAQKTTRRNMSLPDLDSFSSFLNGAPKDAFRLGMPVKNAANNNTNKENGSHVDLKSVRFIVDKDACEQLDAIVETEFQNNTVERSDNSASIDETEVRRTYQDQEIGITTKSESELAQEIESSVVDPCFSDYITSHAEFSITEGLGLNTKSLQANESDSSFDLQSRNSIDSLPASSNIVNTEIELKSLDNQSREYVVDNVDDQDSEFNYVKYVLELSGFIGHEDLGTWYSLDQPLDPTLFKELEACFQHEPESNEEQVTAGNLDHQLLFDLVNETLLEVYERSYTYFPRALSFSGCMRPMPKGQRLLDDVWTRVSSYLKLRPEMDQTLDDVVARDLAKGDRWMNLQWETECVTLELEDLIFDELLDEVVCV